MVDDVVVGSKQWRSTANSGGRGGWWKMVVARDDRRWWIRWAMWLSAAIGGG